MTTNTTTTAMQASADQVNDAALCFQQSMMWMQRCYALGAVQIEEADEIAAAKIRRMTAAGLAHIEARMDLSQQSCTFFFCHDAAGEDAVEMELMTLFVKPPAPPENQH